MENQHHDHAAVVRGGGELKESSSTTTMWSETKKQVRLTAPLAVGFLLQKVIQTISIMFVGRLGQLPLASASLATSFASVTGFSLLVDQTCIYLNEFHSSATLLPCFVLH